MTERYHACVAASRLGVRVVGNSLYMIIRIFGPNDLLFQLCQVCDWSLFWSKMNAPLFLDKYTNCLHVYKYLYYLVYTNQITLAIRNSTRLNIRYNSFSQRISALFKGVLNFYL